MSMQTTVAELLLNHKVDFDSVKLEENHPMYSVYVNPKNNSSLRKAQRLAPILGMKLNSISEPIVKIDYEKGMLHFGLLMDNHPLVNYHEFVSEQTLVGEIPCFLGTKDITKPIVLDLQTAPHVIIGGTTGSGKSMMLHCIINSLFAVAEKGIDVSLIDPKYVEFVPYASCKFTKSIANTKECSYRIISEHIEEMNRRLQLLNKKGLRDWKDYRKKGSAHKKPYKIIIIDELSDLILSSGKAFQDLLVHLLQKSRAAGIHVVAATQHPSSKVIPGELRANFPCVIGCKVASSTHSRVLFGCNGAEKLIGKGDAYINGLGFNMQRFQGALVDMNIVDKNQRKISNSWFHRFLR